ncbi:MAG TPA: RusA family crossover junction endodeoxyribonuclease [Candidatus Pelethenecus sp.]|nr:RusA family crossover junction endodeoxyribonuclease [Candidatus Pelethenecus sp.]
MIKFVVYSEVCAKGRPRFRNIGKYVQAYTDKKTSNYENLVKLSFVNSGCKPYMNSETLKCEIKIYRSIPKSISMKKRRLMLDNDLRPITKPDLDNCIKSILDGLNGVAFHDDSQIVHLTCDKYYGEEPRVEIEIWSIDNE